MQIIAWSEGVAQTRELYEMGVYMVVLPEMEAGLEISWAQIGPSSLLINKSIKEAAVRTSTGASIVGFLREEIFYAHPKADFYDFQIAFFSLL